MTFELGDPVRIEMEKWGERRHWQFAGRWLGSDVHGDWIGIPAGTPMSRPGADIVSPADQVGLVPSAALPAGDRWWLATFHAPTSPLVSVYVDIATPPRWDGNVVRTADLDLDVVRLVDGTTYVDDEDEFQEHQVTLGYPDDVVEGATRACRRVLATMTAGHTPYDGSHERWLAAMGDLTARS